ncbi:peptidoglycan-binding protein [Allorhizobium undicola]|uniref:peptidoglycan-binding protein n=1 Tax=Allorhizobium undicola TaxID=78527 RepID=UPI000486F7F4|nr:peptidoglycan-binding protein [Allorhizobium undicola]
MNGQRSPSPRHAGTSSLDALSRTIEGLEARIEGLMGNLPRQEPAGEPRAARPASPARPDPLPVRPDPLMEIRERQRALEASRARPLNAARSKPAETRSPAPPLRMEEPRSPLPNKTLPATHSPLAGAFSPAPREPLPDFDRMLSGAFADLRQDLGRDLSEGLARELQGLRSEIKDIRALAEQSRQSADVSEDLQRLASGLARLEEFARPQSRDLQADVQELRSLIDGLAREDSLRGMEDRWQALENRLETVEPEKIQQELLALAYRLDDIKSQISGMSDARSVRLLEGKLIAIASALEHVGTHLEPNGRAVLEQFSKLDRRLDEISRAIASHRGAGPGDPRLIERLEDRIAVIAHHLELISERTAGHGSEGQLADRIDALSRRIEDMADRQAGHRLEERLDILAAMLERPQTTGLEPEVTGYLADISRRIDAMDHGAMSERMMSQLASISQRLDELERQPQPMPDQTLLASMDQRLYSIAARLDETVAISSHDNSALAGLEQQIAHLSALINAAPQQDASFGAELNGRLAQLEDYLSSSDEYVVEAARQAAEAVMENYSRQAHGSGDQTSEMLGVLAGHLRQLEDIGRGSDERNLRSFDALQQTLLQIADKLEQLEQATRQSLPRLAEPAASEVPAPVPASLVKAAQREIEVAFQGPPDMGTVESPVPDAAASKVETETPEEAESGSPLGRMVGLGRKLMARGRKEEAGETRPAASIERQMVDDAPSIDPADVLPPEEANELLEPGSGTPDVRKILEKVRARQAEQARGASARTDDKMDFIAAARRAAQAAAQEAERGSRTARMPLSREVQGKASAFAKYRRPILMAVGALLLAAMVLPMAKNMIAGKQAPEPAPAPVLSQSVPQAAPQSAPQAAAAPAVASSENAQAPAPSSASPDPAGAAGGLTPEPLKAAAVEPVESVEMAAPDEAPVAPAAPQAEVSGPAIEVPAEIGPASLVAAAKAGDAAAFYEIGSRYLEGRGVTADHAKAAQWYQRAADRGLAPAQYRLAGLYEKGTGVSRDLGRAKALYQQAAEAGNASAMHNLAVIYASGADGKQDMALAAEWFARAAEQGVADSQFNLAVLYAQGSGVKADLEASYKWFSIAAKAGDKDAAAKRDELVKVLKADQLGRARAAADGFKVKTGNADANTVNLPDAWVGKGVTTGSVDMEKAIRNVQAILNRNGFDAGQPDGKLGPKTVAAIKSFQTSVGQEATGKINNDLVKALLSRNG